MPVQPDHCMACPVRQVFEESENRYGQKKPVNPQVGGECRKYDAYSISEGNRKLAKIIRIASDLDQNNNSKRYIAKNTSNIIKALQNLNIRNYEKHYDTEHLVDYNSPLSVREFEILYLSAKGLTNQNISKILSISCHTVKRHFDNIFNKLGVNSRTMAVVWAVRQGLI